MEGFAVAANVAGVLNLGLVVCQELISYYGSLKGAADDFIRMYASIEALAKSLLCLKRSIQKAHLDAEGVKQVEDCIIACENGILSLEKKLKKIQTIAQANPKWTEKMKAHLQRTLYPFKESTLIKLKEICNDLQDDLVLALHVLQIDAASVSMQSLSELQTEVSRISSDINELGTKLDDMSIRVDKTQTIQKGMTLLATFEKIIWELRVFKFIDQYMSAIYKWFFPLSQDFETKQRETFNVPARQDRLSLWVLRTAEYREWLSGSVKPLWCIGSQGVGKTILASSVINNLMTIPESNVGLAYLYCNYSERNEQNPTNLLTCILQQLALRTGVLDNDIEGFYKAKSTLSLGTYSQLLITAAIRLPKIYVVIDALDECLEATRDVLLTELEKLRPKICLMITSRHTFGCHYDHESAMCLTIQAQSGDIKGYLSERVEASRILQAYMKTCPELRDQILDAIMVKAKGMFLLARLHLDSLMAKTTLRRLKLALNELPEVLDKTYDQVLERIKSQNPEHAALALKTLGWIHHAFRPLKVIELQHALAVEEEDSNFDAEGMPDIGLILTVCAGIVAIREGDTMGFVHYTTEEYLERHSRELLPDAPIATAKTCLTYLLFDDLVSPIQTVQFSRDSRWFMRLFLEMHPFLEYASSYWADHARCNTLKNIQGLALKFLRHQGKVLSCMRVRRFERPMRTKEASGLAFAAELDLYDISKALLEEGADVEGQELFDRRPLHTAAICGSKDIVMLLLEHCAKTEAKNFGGRTALHLAVNYGHHDVAKVLLENGATVEAIDRNGRSPLHYAHVSGRCELIALLSDYGAEIDAKELCGVTPLHYATQHGQIESMDLLIDRGANIEARDKEGRTPLLEATELGRTEPIILLIDRGANIEAKDQRGRVLLHHAARHSQIESIKLLVDQGADINARDEEGYTPLYYAVYYGRIESIKLLTDRGADIKARDQRGCIILHYAAYSGQIEYINLLIDRGTDIEARDRQDCTLLHYTAYHGLIQSIQLLIDRGAYIEARDQRGRVLLHHTARHSQIESIKLLVDQGADINARDEEGYTPLHHAMTLDQHESIELLIDQGANVEA